MVGQHEPRLPPLRDDLTLQQGAASITGEPRWLIYDRVRHKYFEITEPAFELLSSWSDSSRGALKRDCQNRFDRRVSDEEIDGLVRFLQANELTLEPDGGDSKAYLETAMRARQNPLMKGVHGYLFIRFPLLRPARFLQSTLPIVMPFYSRTMVWITILTGLAGLYLVSRQWDQFTHTFLHFFSMEGAMYYAISLVFIKTLHELAHAYTATRYGVRVPTMGVALMVLFPVLYTDVTDAWRLKSKRQQLHIAGSGIIVELAIACFATLAWAVLPDGPGKSIAFTLATSSWILSLAVNLNPLMRFDGYYLLADLWGISNLQARSFAIGRWWVREALFGLGQPAPDRFSERTRNLLVVFAISVWIYRFFLFLGIALVVYHLFFKALGVILFAVEILYFIILPVMREMLNWWVIRDEIMKSKRAAVSLAGVVLLVLLAVVPWRGTVEIPAILEADVEASVYAEVSGRVEAIHVKDGETVELGQVLVTLGSGEIEHSKRLTEQKLKLTEERLARVAGGGTELRNGAVLESELAALREEKLGHQRELDRLIVRAPVAGRVRDLNGLIHPGRWVKKDDFIMHVVDVGGAKLRGVMREDDLARITVGLEGRFIPDDPGLRSVPVSLSDVSVAGESELKNNYLSSTFGGSVAVERMADGKLSPLSGVHVVRFSTDAAAPGTVLRGVVHLKGKAESLAAGIWRQVLRVAVREASL